VGVAAALEAAAAHFASNVATRAFSVFISSQQMENS
jgi:isopentenyldiphosphate isomerase